MPNIFNPKNWTLATDHDGDILTNSLGQPATVRGIQSVHQDLSVAVKTDKGEDAIDPEFGSDKFAMQESLQAAEREFRRALAHDDRVQTVLDVDIRMLPNQRENAKVSASVLLRTEYGPDEQTIVFDLGAGTITFGSGF